DGSSFFRRTRELVFSDTRLLVFGFGGVIAGWVYVRFGMALGLATLVVVLVAADRALGRRSGSQRSALVRARELLSSRRGAVGIILRLSAVATAGLVGTAFSTDPLVASVVAVAASGGAAAGTRVGGRRVGATVILCVVAWSAVVSPEIPWLA